MKGAFGGLVAIILLGLYVYSVLSAVSSVGECAALGAACTIVPAASFTEGMALAMSSIGGIVSALVIAELAITQPGGLPGGTTLTSVALTYPQIFAKTITAIYLLVWLAIGVLAFVVGVMQYPKVLEALTNLGYSWLGLAVSAVYAYLGIRPKPPEPVT